MTTSLFDKAIGDAHKALAALAEAAIGDPKANDVETRSMIATTRSQVVKIGERYDDHDLRKETA